MTQPLQPAMLWESADPNTVLAERFYFPSSADAVRWLIDRISRVYGVTVVSVDRLVMSSHNLLAWLTTTDGPRLAKGCGFVMAHERLRKSGELVLWLEQMQLPVSAPLVATMGAVQVLCDHLSLSLQRVIPGELLDPAQPEQAECAGVTLAQLHQALAAYPYAAALAAPAPRPGLLTLIENWATQKRATLTAPALTAHVTSLIEQVKSLATAPLATQLVHGDYRAANILWQAGTLAAVLDFEEVRWGYRVNDLAWAAVHLGTRYHDWEPIALAVQQTFLHSYRAVQPLTALEEVWLPALLAWHSIGLTQAAGKPAHSSGIDTIAFYLDLLRSGKTLQ